MARLYANENFPLDVVRELRALGHDVVTTHDVGKSNQGIEDDAVLRYATDNDRCLITSSVRFPLASQMSAQGEVERLPNRMRAFSVSTGRC
jgi:predicted nuclease of predicted toxin-antitoxin system